MTVLPDPGGVVQLYINPDLLVHAGDAVFFHNMPAIDLTSNNLSFATGGQGGGGGNNGEAGREGAFIAP